MRGGWSLIELLVVVAIISVLTALTASTLTQAKVKAQRVACRVAIRSYAIRFSDTQGKLVIEIPQEANCYQCHKRP